MPPVQDATALSDSHLLTVSHPLPSQPTQSGHITQREASYLNRLLRTEHPSSPLARMIPHPLVEGELPQPSGRGPPPPPPLPSPGPMTCPPPPSAGRSRGWTSSSE